MTAEEQIINRICELQPEYHKSEAMELLTEPGDVGDILRYFMQAANEYASQQRTEGIREGFLAARRWDITADAPNRYLYFTADDYLNSKK